MDLIECIFGISPDGGSGLLEWLLLLMPFAVIASAYSANADTRSTATKVV